jgi:hypothetical protein
MFALSGQCSTCKMVDLCGSSATRVQYISTTTRVWVWSVLRKNPQSQINFWPMGMRRIEIQETRRIFHKSWPVSNAGGGNHKGRPGEIQGGPEETRGGRVDILSSLPYILPACSRYVLCALYVLSLYTVLWSERPERPAAREAVQAVRSGPLVIVIRYHTIPKIDSLYIVMPPPHTPNPLYPYLYQ